MKHAIFNEAGHPLAFYDSEIVDVPEGAVEITDADWSELLAHPGERVWRSGHVEPDVTPPAALDLGAYAAHRRWEIETGGIEVNGVLVRTDERSQAKIAGAVQLLAQDPGLAAVDWEAQPGVWVSADAATLTAIGIAVGRHVQRCFSVLRLVQQGIASGTITTAAQIDAAFEGE